MNEPPDDELADRVAALEATLEELRAELEPPRGPFGLPRPPSPREVIRFTDEYAIPAAIAVLEANIRTLELLRIVLRAGRGAPREEEVRGRAASLGRTTIGRVDRALADLQAAIDDADLPRNDEARSLLEEAKGLNSEIRDALAESSSTRDAPSRASEGGAGADSEPGTESLDDAFDDDESTVEIDVDAELASIKNELDDDEADDEDPAGGENGRNGTDT